MGEEKQPILSLRDLRISFGDKHVLEGISFDVYQGQIIGYIGPNGAGKSTTVKIMLGLNSHYDGEVEIFGQPLSDQNEEYKKKIGYVPEIADLYDNLTALEYLSFTGELYGMDASKAEVKAVELMEIFGLGEAVNTRIQAFSKGMKQKVLIIASLIHDPDLLFFDEPINGLDANSVMVFKEIMRQLAARGKTIFYSSHIMDVVEKISDRIILLSDGKVAADGTFEELRGAEETGTLEDVFNQLTGFNDHESIAASFVKTVEEDSA